MNAIELEQILDKMESDIKDIFEILGVKKGMKKQDESQILLDEIEFEHQKIENAIRRLDSLEARLKR